MIRGWEEFRRFAFLGLLLFVLALWAPAKAVGAATGSEGPGFPPALTSYQDAEGASLFEILRARVQAEPMNLMATIIFLLAIVHTFLAPVFMRLAHRFEHEHRRELGTSGAPCPPKGAKQEVSFKAEVFHLLGEVEAIFGIWVVPLLIVLAFQKDWTTARDYVAGGVHYTEPLFVVVIMTIASSRPVLKLSEKLMALGASLGKRSPAAWWLSILSIGPLLGSFITEPAAMTISALLLGDKIYRYRPRPRLAYATLGLLFVNISVGGTLTHFAAPPVLMVAGKWGWGFSHMIENFGWKAAVGIGVANVVYFFLFRSDLKLLAQEVPRDPLELDRDSNDPEMPFWITATHILFLFWTVLNNHYPAMFIGGFLVYLAFTRATEHHQSELALRPALLVGFFLAGLVVHGGLQGWWISPMLSRLAQLPLFFGSVALTAFNDNAAITYLASLVPSFTAELQYAVVAGAVVGGGLTVIANAPNPAGQSILSRFFPDGVSPILLFGGAFLPTAIMAAMFLLLR